jgi:hypothetical protein
MPIAGVLIPQHKEDKIQSFKWVSYNRRFLRKIMRQSQTVRSWAGAFLLDEGFTPRIDQATD